MFDYQVYSLFKFLLFTIICLPLLTNMNAYVIKSLVSLADKSNKKLNSQDMNVAILIQCAIKFSVEINTIPLIIIFVLILDLINSLTNSSTPHSQSAYFSHSIVFKSCIIKIISRFHMCTDKKIVTVLDP